MTAGVEEKSYFNYLVLNFICFLFIVRAYYSEHNRISMLYSGPLHV
jgi:hypothetical protein